MNKPTYEEIIKEIYKDKPTVLAAYRIGFEKAIEWLLNWQKTQPLIVYYIMVGEETIIDIRRTKESADARIAELTKDHLDVFFWIEERIIE